MLLYHFTSRAVLPAPSASRQGRVGTDHGSARRLNQLFSLILFHLETAESALLLSSGISFRTPASHWKMSCPGRPERGQEEVLCAIFTKRN